MSSKLFDFNKHMGLDNAVMQILIRMFNRSGDGVYDANTWLEAKEQLDKMDEQLKRSLVIWCVGRDPKQVAYALTKLHVTEELNAFEWKALIDKEIDR
jgi:hypothetical protein